mmetsp:Transcript_28543/g.42183  ORF Transcript_28543/g.42183 Transcript_28543/m.42183 type:complete len:153 (+) Transcript_28543:61-519(+)
MTNRTDPPKMEIVDRTPNEEMPSTSTETGEPSARLNYANFGFQHIHHAKKGQILEDATTISSGGSHEEQEDSNMPKPLFLPWLLPQGRPLAAAPPLVKAKSGTVVGSRHKFSVRKRKHLRHNASHSRIKLAYLENRTIPEKNEHIIARISTC